MANTLLEMLTAAAPESGGSDIGGELWAAAITAFVSLLVFALNRRPDSLRRVERLTDIASKMTPSSARTLLEDLRDDYATTWALKEMAPDYPRLRTVNVVAWATGVVTLIIWVFLVLLYDKAFWTWWAYAIGLAFLITALVVGRVIQSKLRTWMLTERSNRWMRGPLHSRIARELNT